MCRVVSNKTWKQLLTKQYLYSHMDTLILSDQKKKQTLIHLFCTATECRLIVLSSTMAYRDGLCERESQKNPYCL